MPKTKDDFLVFHWNLQKKSLNSLIGDGDTAQLVAKGITDNVRRRGKGRNPLPLIGFLQEVIGTKDDVADICARLKEEFKTQRGTEAKHLGGVKFKAYPTGGKPSMKEWTVVVSQGLDVTKIEDLDTRQEYAGVIESDKANAARKKSAFDNRTLKRTAQKQSKEETYRSVQYEAKDFRNGLVAEIKLPGKQTSRVATLHAPGPSIMKDLPALLPAIPRTAAAAKVDFLTGDLNADGNFSKNDEIMKTGFQDVGSHLGGTTFKKSGSAPGESPLGPRLRDRSLLHKDSKLYAKRWAPIAVVRPTSKRSQIVLVPREPSNKAALTSGKLVRKSPEVPVARKRKRRSRNVTTRRKVKLMPTMPKLLTDHALIVTKMRWNEPAPAVAGTSPLQPIPSAEKTFSLTLRKGAAASTRKMTTNENALEDPETPTNEVEMTDVTQMGAEDDVGGEDEDGGADEAEGDAEMGDAEDMGGEGIVDLLALAV